MNFVPANPDRPCCSRCEGSDEDGALKARGDLLLCIACHEGWMGTCDGCGAEVPELKLVDSQLLEGERYCAECAAVERDPCSLDDGSTREGFEE